jgi:hypothetical protein
MKSLSTALVSILICLSSVAIAGASDIRAQQNLYELEPIYTLNARNAQRITVNLNYDNFKNVRLEEADSFDGYTAMAEIIVPFGENNAWEARFEYPFKTEGDARIIRNGKSVDIDGNAGVYDFANLVLQREISTADVCPVNSSIYLGGGMRPARLETDIEDEVYNHTGKMARFGLNIDNARADRNLRLQSTLDVRYFFDSDDINPSDDGDTFYLLDLSGAMVYNAEGFIKPALEVLYSTDLNDRQIIQLIPEVIIPLGDMVEIKGAYAFGNSDGEGSTQTATIRTTVRF